MAISRGPRLVNSGLVLSLDAADNNSFAAQDLPVKSGLVLWLDAADDNSFVYSSGTSVSQWKDKSGNSRDFFQSTAGNQPSRSAVINSRKAIQFTAASSNYLRFNSTIINNRTGGSVFVVWKTAGETSQYSQILDNYHGGANAQYAGFSIERNSTNNQYYWGFQDTGFTPAGNIGSTAYSDNTTYCYWITKDSTTITGGYNGVSVTPVSSPSSTWTEDTKGWLIGSWGSNTETFGRFFNGQIAEIIIFNRGLSITEVKQINTYLGQKWGILNTDRTVYNLADYSKSGLLGNGSTSNMPLYDYYNKGAFKFYASNKYIKLGNNTSVNQFAGDFTVSLWAMATAENSNYGNLIGDYYTAGVQTTNEWQIMMNNSSAFLNVYRHGTGYIVSNTSSGFSANTWINVVLTRIGSAITLYANNTVIATATNSSVFGSATGSVNIGIDGNNSAEPFSGLISNVLIYNKGLTATEVAQNYNAQKSRYTNTIVQQGLVLNLDAGNPYSYAGAGTIWYDTSGNSFNGALTNGPVYSSTNSGIITFDGQNDYVDLSTSTLPISGNGARSIFVWMKTTATGLIGYVSTGTPASSQAFNLVKYSAGVGVMGYNNDYYPAAGAAGVTLTDGNWHYIGATFDGSNLRTYVDGILDNTSGAISYSTTGQYNYIGRSNHAGNENFLNGSIGLTQIYNRALSITEIVKNYNATKSRYGL